MTVKSNRIGIRLSLVALLFKAFSWDHSGMLHVRTNLKY